MTDTLDYAGPMTAPQRHEVAAWWWARVWYGLGAIAAPLVCWVASFWPSAPPHPEWQSGQWNHVAGVLLAGQASWPMFGLMAYSMLAMCLLLINRPFFAQWFVVRLGVYTGMVLAGLYGIVLLAATQFVGATISAVVLAGLVVPVTAFWWLIRRAGIKWVLVGIGALAVLGLMVAGLILGFSALPVILIAVLGSGPLVTFCACLVMGWWLYRNAPSARRTIAATWWLTWLLSFGGSTWATTIAAMHFYQSLPKTPPNKCYIASMAARGHRRVVRSGWVRCADGHAYAVNDQLRVLKAGEVVIAALAPQLHATMRRVYDAWGPWLAARVVNAYGADAAYILLKVFELPTAFVLKTMGLWELAMRFYREE